MRDRSDAESRASTLERNAVARNQQGWSIWSDPRRADRRPTPPTGRKLTHTLTSFLAAPGHPYPPLFGDSPCRCLKDFAHTRRRPEVARGPSRQWLVGGSFRRVRHKPTVISIDLKKLFGKWVRTTQRDDYASLPTFAEVVRSTKDFTPSNNPLSSLNLICWDGQ